MSTEPATPPLPNTSLDPSPARVDEYNGRPSEFVRESKALYEHHLVFDDRTIAEYAIGIWGATACPIR
ncbi:MAG: hypothetical protein ACLQO1_10200 [Steroidobacteraceae bacterium]